MPTVGVSPDRRVPGFVVLYGESKTAGKVRQRGEKKFRQRRAGARGYRGKPALLLQRIRAKLPTDERVPGEFAIPGLPERQTARVHLPSASAFTGAAVEIGQALVEEGQPGRIAQVRVRRRFGSQ